MTLKPEYELCGLTLDEIIHESQMQITSENRVVFTQYLDEETCKYLGFDYYQTVIDHYLP